MAKSVAVRDSFSGNQILRRFNVKFADRKDNLVQRFRPRNVSLAPE